MNINGWLLEHYLGYVTVSWFDETDLPPDDVREYSKCVLWMKYAAENCGDLDVLLLAFEHVLGRPDIDVSEYARTRYPYSDADAREIIAFARQVIRPDAEAVKPGGPPGVSLDSLSRSSFKEWNAEQSKHLR